MPIPIWNELRAFALAALTGWYGARNAYKSNCGNCTEALGANSISERVYRRNRAGRAKIRRQAAKTVQPCETAPLKENTKGEHREGILNSKQHRWRHHQCNLKLDVLRLLSYELLQNPREWQRISLVYELGDREIFSPSTFFALFLWFQVSCQNRVSLPSLFLMAPVDRPRSLLPYNSLSLLTFRGIFLTSFQLLLLVYYSSNTSKSHSLHQPYNQEDNCSHK